MKELVHRVAPSSARARMLLVAVMLATAFGGVVGTTMAGSTPAIAFAVLVTVAAVGIAVSLGSGLIEQAEAAPSAANPAMHEPQSGEPESDPITTLQQRYAEGELTDAEFERRMEQLMESDDHARQQPRNRTTEPELEQ